MGIIEVLLIGVGLSMDAFAVAVCQGLNMRKIEIKRTLLIALFFGGFQGGMPAIGYILGAQFEKYVDRFAPYIAFLLLAFIGGKMIFEALKGDDDGECCDNFSIKMLTVLAIATSIDALAVGITFALTPPSMGIVLAVLLIGIITFIFSLIGVMVGNRFGARFKSKAEVAGGVILCLIGIKFLLEGIGII